MLDPLLLQLLVCPETKQRLSPLPAERLQKLAALIQEGRVRNRSGALLRGPLSGALLREDGQLAYPVVDDIPVMLSQEAIPCEGF